MNEVQLQPVVVARESRPEQLRVISDVVSFIITGAETNGAYALFETVTQPGGGTPPHTQAHEDEAFYILEGRYSFLVGDQQVEVGPGGYAFVPRGTVHAYTNSGEAPARMLILVAPGGLHEQFFREAGDPADAPAGAPDFARLGAAAAKYGITILPPQA